MPTTRRSDLLRWGRQMEGHVEKAMDLLWRIRECDHPRAGDLYDRLKDEIGTARTAVEDIVREVLDDEH